MDTNNFYQSFINAPSGKNWSRIGLNRRAGVAAPLFSIYSKKSIGIGELPDLKLLIDWCKRSGLSIIQLLPMNDVGTNFQPYDAASGFALEPMYLSLAHLKEVHLKKFTSEINRLKKRFPAGEKRVNYRIKAAKLDLLWQIFQSRPKNSTSFNQFVSQNQNWIEDYACFKVFSEENSEKSWEVWPVALKEKREETVERFRQQHLPRIDFYKWLQWQMYCQFKDARKYAKRKGILIMGDLPFLAARNSADVWSHPNYFKLDLSSGAPPDAYFAKGQRWGMPPCNWEAIAANDYDYVNERLTYAENFYDLLRIDHVTGLFRLRSIPITEPFESGGLHGFFDPPNEEEWEEHGRKLLSIFLKSKMLACAEDLGTVPECSYKVLAELAIPGIDVQRWTRDLNESTTFKSETNYRKNSIATISTHDMTSFQGWWTSEAGTVYEPLFKRQCESRGIDFNQARQSLFDLENSKYERLRWKEDVTDEHVLAARLNKGEHEIGDLINDYHFSFQEKQKFLRYLEIKNEGRGGVLIKAALKKVSNSLSIFSVQLLLDWLDLADIFKEDPWEIRFNFPGTVSEKNWSLVMPISLEEMQKLSINKEIKEINKQAGRC